MHKELESLLKKVRNIRSLDNAVLLRNKMNAVKIFMNEFRVGHFVIVVSDFKSEVAYRILNYAVSGSELTVIGDHGIPLRDIYRRYGVKHGCEDFTLEYEAQCCAVEEHNKDNSTRVAIVDVDCKEDILLHREEGRFSLFSDLYLHDVTALGEYLGIIGVAELTQSVTGVDADFMELYLSLNEDSIIDSLSAEARHEFNEYADMIDTYRKWKYFI